MKRRDPNAERERWHLSFARWHRPFWRRRSFHAVASSLVAAALGFGMVLVLGVVVYGPPSVSAAPRSFVTKASWYDEDAGEPTAYGERFDPDGMTAAHLNLPHNTRLRVCRLTGPLRCVVVRINDKGPATWTGRGIDLARGAARELDMIEEGVIAVRVEQLNLAWPAGLNQVRG